MFIRPLHISAVLLSVFILCLMPLSTVAQERTPEQSLQQLAENVFFTTLPNGLRVIMYRRGIAPVFAGVVTIRVGGVNERDGFSGAAHMLEHMAFKGTDTIGTRDFKRESLLLEELNEILGEGQLIHELSEQDQQRVHELHQELSELWEPDELSQEFRIRGGVGLNATTSQDLTNYFINLPTSAFEFWCWLESERILHPVMRQFYQERDVVMEERRMRYDDSPSGKLYEQILQNAFEVHPYRHPVIGYARDIERLTVAEVTRLHNEFYTPSNMVVSIVGDIDPERDLKIVERYFGRIPAGPAPQHPTVKEPPQTIERVFQIFDPSSPRVMLAYHKPNYPHPDDPAITLMLEMFAGSSISPLYELLVKNERIATSFSYFEAPGSAYPNLMIFHGVARNPHTNQDLLQGFDRAVELFLEEYLTQERLEIARRSVLMSYLGRLQSNTGLARDLAASEVIYGDWSAFLGWLEKTRAVELEDIRGVVAQYLVKERRTVGLLETEGGQR